MLKSYLRYRQFLFLWTGIVLAIYAFLQYLYWYPLESIGYTALIVLDASGLDFCAGLPPLPPPAAAAGLVDRSVDQSGTGNAGHPRSAGAVLSTADPETTRHSDGRKGKAERRAETAGRTGHDVVHQIKLPLASLSLILESLEPEDTISASHLNEMKLALMRTEQYAQPL